MAILFTPALVPAGSYNSLLSGGARWYFYLTGTTTAANAYTAADLVTPLANPLASDGAGKFAAVYLDPDIAYRAILKNTAGTISYLDIDPVNQVDDSTSAASAAAQAAADSATTASDAASTAQSAVAAVGEQTTGLSSITFSPGEKLADDEFASQDSWSLATGWSFQDSTDGLVSNTLKANAAIRSVNGDGSTSQVSTSAYLSDMIRIRPSKWFYLVADVLETSSFAGMASVSITFYKRDGVTTTGSTTTVNGTDFRTIANTVTATETLEVYAKGASDAYYVRVTFTVTWPTVIPSAGYAYYAKPRVEKARQSSPGIMSFGTAKTHVIASGIITLDGSTSNIILDTEGSAGTDDLDTINGGEDGFMIIVRTTNSARDVTVKDGTGNINLPADVTLSTTADRLILVSAGSTWFGAAPLSDNQ